MRLVVAITSVILTLMLRVGPGRQQQAGWHQAWWGMHFLRVATVRSSHLDRFSGMRAAEMSCWFTRSAFQSVCVGEGQRTEERVAVIAECNLVSAIIMQTQKYKAQHGSMYYRWDRYIFGIFIHGCFVPFINRGLDLMDVMELMYFGDAHVGGTGVTWYTGLRKEVRRRPRWKKNVFCRPLPLEPCLELDVTLPGQAIHIDLSV